MQPKRWQASAKAVQGTASRWRRHRRHCEPAKQWLHGWLLAFPPPRWARRVGPSTSSTRVDSVVLGPATSNSCAVSPALPALAGHSSSPAWHPLAIAHPAACPRHTPLTHWAKAYSAPRGRLARAVQAANSRRHASRTACRAGGGWCSRKRAVPAAGALRGACHTALTPVTRGAQKLDRLLRLGRQRATPAGRAEVRRLTRPPAPRSNAGPPGRSTRAVKT